MRFIKWSKRLTSTLTVCSTFVAGAFSPPPSFLGAAFAVGLAAAGFGASGALGACTAGVAPPAFWAARACLSAS